LPALAPSINKATARRYRDGKTQLFFESHSKALPDGRPRRFTTEAITGNSTMICGKARPITAFHDSALAPPFPTRSWVEPQGGSANVLLRRDLGVESIDLACVAPSPYKGNGERGAGRRNFHFSATCISLQTVCEQSASSLDSLQGVHRFVIEVHRIVTAATLQDGSQTTKNA
jgi:hypothetical protein